MNRSRLLPLAMALSVSALCLAPSVALASYGDLDATFGSGGKIRSGLPPVGVQPDGKILVMSGSSSNGYSLRRLTKRGAPDKAFAHSGLYSFSAPSEDIVDPDLEVLDDGRIAILTGAHLTLLRPSGRRDRSFGEAGKMALGKYGMRAKSLAIQDGSRLLVSGPLAGSTVATSVMRFKPDGTLDSSFGVAGTASALGSSAEGSAIAVGKTGEIYLGLDVYGEQPTTFPSSMYSFGGVAKFSRDGMRISGYGRDGVAPVRYWGSNTKWGIRTIAPADNGNLVVIGYGAHFFGKGGGFSPTTNYLNADGTVARPPDFEHSPGYAVALPSSGFFLSGHRVFQALRDDFSVDTRFDSAGPSLVNVGECGYWGPVAVYPDGSLLARSEQFSWGECEYVKPVLVRVLGPSGGKVAPPQATITSSVGKYFYRSGKYRSWLRKVSGVAGPGKKIRKVQVAIQRIDQKLLKKGRCRWLKDQGTRSVTTKARHGKCIAPHFMPVTGRTAWKFRIRRPLPRGKYRLYVRATTPSGVVTPLSKDLDNYRFFIVRR